MEDMGRPESTGTFIERLEDVIQTAAAVGAALDRTEAHVDEAARAVAQQVAEDLRREDDWAISVGDGTVVTAGMSENGTEDDEDDDEDQRVELVLQRRVRRGKLFYKVLWRGANCVSWELEENIDDKRSIAEFERRYTELYARPGKRRLPPSYIPRRQLARIPLSEREALAARQSALQAYRGGGSSGAATVIWSCEVERHIWIPYDAAVQRTIEDAFCDLTRQAVRITVGEREYTVLFRPMAQVSGRVEPDSFRDNMPTRRVQRVVQLPEEEERQRMMTLSLEELRRHIATIDEFQPVHYEMLARLHELDKVATHASPAQLEQALHSTTFDRVLEQISEGAHFPGYSEECFVCLEEYAIGHRIAVLPRCGHLFHEECARSYFKKYSKLCPVCKVAIC